MSKTNSIKYLLLAGIFVVTFGIGYFGVKVVCNSKFTDKETIAQNDKEVSSKGGKLLTPPTEEEPSEAQTDTVATQPAITETQGQTNPRQEASTKREQISLNPSKPELWGDGYRFRCTCTGVPEEQTSIMNYGATGWYSRPRMATSKTFLELPVESISSVW